MVKVEGKLQRDVNYADLENHVHQVKNGVMYKSQLPNELYPTPGLIVEELLV